MTLPAIRVAVGGDEYLRLDLAEAIEDARHPEVRRTGRPHRADRGRSKRRDDRFRQVRQIPGDAISGLYAFPAQPSRERGDGPVQLGVGQGSQRPVLFLEDQGRRRTAVRQQVLGEVQRGIREEHRARHAVQVLDDARAHRPAHPAEFPHQPPEILRTRDGEGVEGGVVGDRDLTAGRDCAHERRQPGGRDTVGRGCPQRAVHTPL